jgi:hypothetical protein
MVDKYKDFAARKGDKAANFKYSFKYLNDTIGPQAPYLFIVHREEIFSRAKC